MTSCISDRVVTALAPFLGPHTARNAVRLFAQRSLGLRPEQVTLVEAGRLVEALGPMLRTLVGEEPARELVERLRAKVSAP